jgi:Ca-activated chloride channel family protein
METGLKQIFIISLFIFIRFLSYAQDDQAAIRNGNKWYKQQKFDESVTEYKKAITLSPENPLANYNLGNAQVRTNRLEDAVGSYAGAIKNSEVKPVKQKAFYNQGVAYVRNQKLQESIDAWKNALKLDPKDKEARENLQKALLEQKKQQKKDDQKKDEKKKKDQNQKQDKKDQQSPKQPKNKLSQKQVEQLLKALAQKEKEVQQKMQAKESSPNRQEKDW